MIWNENERRGRGGGGLRAAEELRPINIHKYRWLVVVAQKSGKINGAQETKGYMEVKGQEEDEQCGAGEISQPCENSQVAKFIGCENSQTWKFHTTSKTLCLLQHLQNREPKMMRKHNCK